jgi:hypothetical protein
MIKSNRIFFSGRRRFRIEDGYQKEEVFQFIMKKALFSMPHCGIIRQDIFNFLCFPNVAGMIWVYETHQNVVLLQ